MPQQKPSRSQKTRRKSPETTPNAISPSKTISWDELEEWQKDNEYIRTGYRRYVLLHRLVSPKAWYTDAVNVVYSTIGVVV